MPPSQILFLLPALIRPPVFLGSGHAFLLAFHVRVRLQHMCLWCPCFRRNVRTRPMWCQQLFNRSRALSRKAFWQQLKHQMCFPRACVPSVSVVFSFHVQWCKVIFQTMLLVCLVHGLTMKCNSPLDALWFCTHCGSRL